MTFGNAPKSFQRIVKKALCLSASHNFIFKLRQNIEPSFNTSGYCVTCLLMFADR